MHSAFDSALHSLFARIGFAGGTVCTALSAHLGYILLLHSGLQTKVRHLHAICWPNDNCRSTRCGIACYRFAFLLAPAYLMTIYIHYTQHHHTDCAKGLTLLLGRVPTALLRRRSKESFMSPAGDDVTFSPPPAGLSLYGFVCMRARMLSGMHAFERCSPSFLKCR